MAKNRFDIYIQACLHLPLINNTMDRIQHLFRRLKLKTFWKRIPKWVVLLCVLTFGIILPVILYRVPHSVYYMPPSDLKENMITDNDARAEWATQELTRLKPLDPSKTLHGQTINPDIAITVITMSRGNTALYNHDNYVPRYLTQTIAKLYTLQQEYLSESKGNDYLTSVITVCNVDPDVSSYTEDAQLNWLVPHIYRFPKPPSRTSARFVNHINENEKQDYVFCLNQSLALNPKYVLLLEDDAFPLNDTFHVLADTIKHHVHSYTSHGEGIVRRDNLAFVKFFHPERLLSYTRRPDVHLSTELLSASLVLGSLIFYLHRSILTETNQISLYYTWFGWIMYSMLVLICVGHVNVFAVMIYFAPNLYNVRPAPSCCTPAILYPSTRAGEVINYMNATRCRKRYAKDSVLDDLLADTGLKALYREPNIFKHIGMYSVSKSKYLDAVIV